MIGHKDDVANIILLHANIWLCIVGEGECIWLIYFIFLYENKTMKTSEVILSGEFGGGRNEEELWWE
jgi:hypothetical protein